MVNLIVKCSNDRAERSATYVTEQLIEGLMSTIKASKKPLPVWAIDMAMRAYETWKIYQNGQKVEKVQRVVLSVLEHVAEIKDQLTRELLDEHARRIDSYVSNMRQIEDRVLACEGRTDELRRSFSRKGCGVGHAWRNGRCVDVAENPR